MPAASKFKCLTYSPDYLGNIVGQPFFCQGVFLNVSCFSMFQHFCWYDEAWGLGAQDRHSSRTWKKDCRIWLAFGSSFRVFRPRIHKTGSLKLAEIKQVAYKHDVFLFSPIVLEGDDVGWHTTHTPANRSASSISIFDVWVYYRLFIFWGERFEMFWSHYITDFPELNMFAHKNVWAVFIGIPQFRGKEEVKTDSFKRAVKYANFFDFISASVPLPICLHHPIWKPSQEVVRCFQLVCRRAEGIPQRSGSWVAAREHGVQVVFWLVFQCFPTLR